MIVDFPIQLLNKNKENIYYYQDQTICNRKTQRKTYKKWICYNIDILHIL